MNLLSAKNVFSDIFSWFANLSSKLPAIDYKTYFIVVVALLLGIGFVVALTYFGSYRFKLLVACRKIISYLANVEAIDNDNFGDFTSQCFSEKVPSTLRDCWVQYLGVRFGYPSDILSEQNVYDKEVKRVREIRANVYIAVALILIAIFSFWGYGRLDGKDMGVIFLASLLISAVIYLLLVIFNKMLSNTCLDVFNNMQEDLDAKVVFQVEKTFATDSSPLGDLAAIIDEIIARNTAKDIGFEFGDEKTPIEDLIAKADEPDKPIDRDVKETEEVEEKSTEDKEEVTEDKEASVEETEPADDGEVEPELEEEDTAESEPVVEEGAVSEPEIDNISIDEVIAEEAEATEKSEPIVEEETAEATASEAVEEEPAVESEPVIEEEPVVDDGAIDGIVEDIKVESEPEQKEEQAEVISDPVIGDPVEIVFEKKAEEKQEDKAPADEEQKKTLNDNEQKVEEEPAVEASLDIAEQVIEEEPAPEVEEQPAPEVTPEPEEQKVDENQPAQAEEPVQVEELKEEPKEEPAAAVASSDEPIVQEEPAVKEEKPNKAKTAKKKAKSDDSENAEDDEPIIQYVMDGPMDDDDDEIVKPAQLVKMPNLVDYMIANNTSPKMKMNIVNKLMASYKKFENSEEDKQIIIDCIKKLMADLQGKK